MTAMRALDAAFLSIERDAEPSHLGTVMVFDPAADGPLTAPIVRELLRARLPSMPSARRVVVEAPLGLGRPSWRSVTPDLDVHVRADTVRADDGHGGMRALADLVADRHARRLDRRRPLWELHVIDGLEAHRVALYAKVHVVALDDTTGVDLMTALLDHDGEAAATIEPAAVFDDRRERSMGLAGRWLGPVPDQLRRAAGFPVRVAGRASRSVGEQLPGWIDTTAELARRTPGLGRVARLLPDTAADLADGEHANLRAPRLSFNAPIGPERCVAFVDVSTPEVRAVAEAHGATLNEVLLSVLVGALRRWLIGRDELPTSPLVAIVPVLVADDSGEGTHIAGLDLPIPTTEPDPSRRLARTCEVVRAAKRRPTREPASIQHDLAMFTPPAVAALATRLLDALPHRPFVGPTVNLGVTNVPGPKRPVGVAGRPLVAGHPVLSVSDLTPLHLAVQPGPERTGIAAVACRDHVDELWSLVDTVPDELSQLRSP